MIINALKQKGCDIGYYNQSEWSDVVVISSVDFNKWIPVLKENKGKGQIVVFDLPENEFSRTAAVTVNKLISSRRYIYKPKQVLQHLKGFFKRQKFDASLEAMVKLSDHVTVSSEDTFNSVSELTKNCTIIYEPIDAAFPKMPKTHTDKGTSIVWIGNHHNTKYLIEIKDTLNKVIRDNSVNLKIITSPLVFDVFPELKTTNAFLEFEFIPWRLDTIWAELAKADIGIAPLFRQIWKSPNKIVTYWAAGLPVVVSPSLAYSNIIETGRNGFIASDAVGWESSLLKLLKDPGLRNNLGRRGYQKAVSLFSIDQISEQWRKLFEDLFLTRRLRVRAKMNSHSWRRDLG